jgi:replicative DNA helicase
VSELYDHEVERSVLGILSNISAIDVHRAKNELERSGLTRSSFHHERYRDIFLASEGILRAGAPIEPIAVKDQVGDLGKLGGAEFVAEVLLGQPHLLDSALPSFAKILNELSVRRGLYRLLEDARSKVTNRDLKPEELVADVSTQLAQVKVSDTKIMTMSDLLVGMSKHLEEVANDKTQPIIPTGIGPLDHVIGGLQPTLILVGALPGVGKSALVSTLVHNLSRHGRKVGVISLEDEASWLPWRILSREAGLEQFIMRFRKLNEFQGVCAKEGMEAMLKYSNNVLLADGSDHPMAIEQVSATATDMVVNHGAQAIIVDHLGEIAFQANADRYDLEVATHLSRLRGISNRHGVPVICALHLRRREGLTPGAKPNITDFANSSGAERKARVALALSRGEAAEAMHIHILKNTLGKGTGMSVEVPFHGPSAMLKSEEGKRVEVRRREEPGANDSDSSALPGGAGREDSKKGPGRSRNKGGFRNDQEVVDSIWGKDKVRTDVHDAGSDKLPWD